jgi:hypothetical protein
MLSIADDDDVKVSVVQKVEKIPAKNLIKAEETVRRQIMKLGDSIFVSEILDIVWSQPYFIPVSVCNEIRRKAVAQLEEERRKKFTQRQSNIIPNSEPYPTTHLDYSANVANKKSESFYRRHGVEIIEPAFELRHSVRVSVMTMKYCLRFQYDLCTGQGAANADPLFLQDAKNMYRLEFDCEACQMKIVLENRVRKK